MTTPEQKIVCGCWGLAGEIEKPYSRGRVLGTEGQTKFGGRSWVLSVVLEVLDPTMNGWGARRQQGNCE